MLREEIFPVVKNSSKKIDSVANVGSNLEPGIYSIRISVDFAICTLPMVCGLDKMIVLGDNEAALHMTLKKAEPRFETCCKGSLDKAWNCYLKRSSQSVACIGSL